ncbi:MAG: transglutaminase domain-containing protein [Anaerolineales bacterium]|nr:transglutaminase domain-containing protein [Anaerolineales bacterium]
MLLRLKSNLTKQFSWYRLLSYPLFLITIFITIFVIGRLDRSIHLDNLRQIVLLAALFGLLLSLIRDPKPLMLIILSFFSGVIVVYTNIGNLIQPFFTYIRLGFKHLLSLIQSQPPTEEILPNAAQAQAQWNVLEQSIQVLYERQIDWVLNLPESVYDPVSLNLTWGILVWLITIWTYWHAVRKKQVVVGFIPALIIIAAANPSIESGLVWLFLILGIALCMVILSNQSKLEDFWQEMRLNVSERIRMRTTQYALYLSIGLVFFAGLITSPQLDDFIDDIRDRRTQADGQGQGQGESGTSDSAILEEETTIGAEQVLGETADGWLPNVHLIGSGPELADIEVLHASVQEPNAGLAPRYYFRSATYETFNLNGWQNIDKDSVFIPPEEEFEIDFTPNQKLLYQEVTLLRDLPKGNLMYVVGELTAANVYYYGSFHTKFVNNTYTDLFASVTDATEYAAYSITPFYGENDLRSASQEYPAWIENKYLQVPDSITDRVYDLAISLTATQPTPYDRVLSIENYLRGFEYTLEIEAPPRSQDIVDYFLFDLQKGYCDYYASAMVILTRAAGIPARLATGYLASTYDPEAGHFTVTEDQAHSWAEVYFPEYGWVTFEPTAGQPALIRQEERQLLPERLASEPQVDIPNPEPEKGGGRLMPDNLFILAGELSLLAAVGLAVFHWADKWFLSRMNPNKLLSEIYRRLRKLSKRMGINTNSTDTPLEFTNILTDALESLGKNKPMQILLASTPQKAAFIIQISNQAAYSNRPIESEQLRQAIHFWGVLRWQFLVARFLIRLQPFHASLKRVWFRLQQPA